MNITEKILSNVKTLPTISQTVAKLGTLMTDEKSNSADFEKVVRLDPSLTANLLRLSNSAFYGLPVKIESVQQAVTHLGTKRVYDIAVMATLYKTIPSVMPVYETDSQAFWLHCVSVAVIAQNLAKRVPGVSQDHVFTAGILHDIGKVVLYSALGNEEDKYFAAMKQPEVTPYDAERIAVGADHAQVGEELLKRWRFSDMIKAAARYHHTPVDEADHALQQIADIIHIADCLAHQTGESPCKGEASRFFDAASMGRLNLTPEMLEAIMAESTREIDGFIRFIQEQSII